MLPRSKTEKMRRLTLLFTLLVASLGAFTPVNAADALNPSLAERERMARESRQALSFLGDYHYSQKTLQNFKTADIVRDYAKALDYSHMFFTEAQIEGFIKRFEPTMQTVYLARGDLFPAIDIANTYIKNAKARLEWIKKRLKGEFDFGGREYFTPDRTKADWPATARDADELWNKRLTYELQAEMLNGASLTQAKEKLLKRYERADKVLDEFDLRDLQTVFLTTLGGLFDPHSSYFSKDELEDFSITMSNTLVGIGALLKDEDGTCVIQELIPGGPAEISGLLHVGDKIVEVAEEGEQPVDIVGQKISKVVKLIRGEPGSTVVLTIVPATASDSSVRKTVRLERNEVHLTENLASAQVIEVPTPDGKKTVPIGVIELPSFYGGADTGASNTTDDLKELIGKLQGMGIKGLVLDLRRNGGGLLNEAVNMVGLFAPRAPAVQVRDSTGRVRVDWAPHPGDTAVYDGPLVVLTSRESASASEIVAGALQCLGRAVVVGDRATHGKGTVQAIFEIDRGLLARFVKQTPSGGIKITIQKFYLPNGASTQNKGVVSDIALPSINDVLPIGESDIPHALPWDTIAAVSWNKSDDWKKVSLLDDATREKLIELSSQRQNDLPEFKYLNEVVSRLKAKQAEKAVSLNFDVRLKEKQLNENWTAESEKKRRELSPLRYASADVLLDISWQMKAEHQQKLQNTPLPDGSPRAGAVYENIFYFAPEGGLDIKEIKADKLNYEALATYADTLGKKLGLTSAQMQNLFDRFKQASTRDEFNIRTNFEKALGTSVSKDRLEKLPAQFFSALVELNPELAEDHWGFDIPLREALRVAADWVEIKEPILLAPQKAKAPKPVRMEASAR